MQFIATADTDIGISKETNQDSVLIKHASTKYGEVLLSVICDGMGGLSKGEVASATVIRTFSQWFDNELPSEISLMDINVIGGKWELMLKDLNVQILEYGKSIGISLGTTFTGVLMFGEQYLMVHVGDTRFYYLSNEVKQISEDQTVVAREIRRGKLTVEEARTDKKRNMLLQCIGASKVVEPQVICGKIEKGIYMICSDGFRHEISKQEIIETLNPLNLVNKKTMHRNAKYLIDLVKSRREKDNISVVLIKTE